MVKQAIILAAGKGERLYPLTSARPKVMLPVGNKPILQHVLEALRANNVEEVVIVVGYFREQIQDYFGSGERFGLRISYSIQEHQLGTGHALLCARGKVRDEFLVLPGDNMIDAETLRGLQEKRQETILVKEDSQGQKYGVVIVQSGLVRTILEKPEEQPSPWINTGTYLLNETIFDYLVDELELPMSINRMIQDGKEFAIHPTKGTWLDAVYPWDLLHLNGIVLQGIDGEETGIQEPGVFIKGPVQIGANSIVRSNSTIIGPVIIGEGCEIGPQVCIFPYTTLGNNVVVDSFTQIRNCIIGNSVQIGSHSILDDSIIAEGTMIGSRFSAPSAKQAFWPDGKEISLQVGAIVSDFSEVGSGVSLSPGITVGRGARIRDLNAVREHVPEDSLVI